jgi:hypothetical protein
VSQNTKEHLMKKWTLMRMVSSSLLVSTLIVGCGGSSSNESKGQGNESSSMGGDMGEGSNIPYLKKNHANYAEHGSQETPVPTKDANAKSIDWTISANTEEGAVKLQEHLAFMEKRLLNDKNPRGWDKLFLMEAYMKYNKYYTTSVERSDTNVVVSKNANTSCAYKVISAHSDAVSGDFFAQGNIQNDYSSIAEGILVSSACDDVRISVETYINQRQKSKH